MPICTYEDQRMPIPVIVSSESYSRQSEKEKMGINKKNLKETTIDRKAVIRLKAPKN